MLPLILGGAQALGGLFQMFSGKSEAEKAQEEMERMTRNYKPNESIMDYYEKAFNNFSANPYTSAMYQNFMRQAGRNFTSSLGAAQDRRGGLAAVSTLNQNMNDASLKAVAAAENEQDQDLAMLGQATQMKAQEEFRPFEMRYNLLSAKAGGANQTANAGIQNIFGGLGSMSNYFTAKEMYGTKQPTTK